MIGNYYKSGFTFAFFTKNKAIFINSDIYTTLNTPQFIEKFEYKVENY
jgi:hypothetical protein